VEIYQRLQCGSTKHITIFVALDDIYAVVILKKPSSYV
jgi:hypothetical protein